MKKNHLKNTDGQVLLAALIIMTVGFTIGVGFLINSRIAYKTNQAQLDAQRAYYLAVSGREIATAELRDDFLNWAGITTPLAMGGGTITVTVDPAAPRGINDTATATITGTFRDANQVLTAEFTSS